MLRCSVWLWRPPLSRNGRNLQEQNENKCRQVGRAVSRLSRKPARSRRLAILDCQGSSPHHRRRRPYKCIAKFFASQESVDHSRGEYGRGDVITNTVESSFSIFKCGMKGVYQHCGERHLHRYLAEFDFRYCKRARLGIDDKQRADNAVKGIVGSG